MKVVDANICAECDEVFEGYVCPVCGLELGIPVRNTISPISGGRVRRAPTPPSGQNKLRIMPKSLPDLIREAGNKLARMESLR
jgi:hypothetical protein